MDKVHPVPDNGNPAVHLTVVGNRPVTMPCPHLYEKDQNGKPKFTYTPGPSILSNWLATRKP